MRGNQTVYIQFKSLLTNVIHHIGIYIFFLFFIIQFFINQEDIEDELI
jgi:hypothetical protein